MTNGQKDTIYIDIDDEITSVIDKLQGSPHRIVALVLPKRAATFQSIVNMKLLKRVADESKKHIVLITSETALMPLAGAVGLHVAKTLQSKPEIPPGPGQAEPVVPENVGPLDPNAPVGELAGLPPETEDSIEVDNSEDTPSKAAKPGKAPKKGKNGKKGFRIPNFDKFRKRLLLGAVALIVLIGGFIMAFMVLPKATVTLKTDTSNLAIDTSFTAHPAARDYDEKNKILPAISKEFRKTDTERVPATGQKNEGKKASGTVVLKNCSATTGSVSIPKGTGVSSGNLTFVTQKSVSLPESSFNANDECTTATADVDVTASQPGESYNLDSGKKFTVAGYSGVEATNSSQMTGGTDKIIKIVTQGDIDKAKQAIQERAGNEAPDDLQDDIRDEGYYPLQATLKAGEPTVTSTPALNAEANEVTVTSTTVYTMLGVKEDDLKKLIESQAKNDIDENTQVIRDNGLAKAEFGVRGTASGGEVTVSLKTIAVAGPDLDDEAVKREIAGKSRGEVQDIIGKRPGINGVEVAYSPFWVQSTPKSTSKITIVFEDSKTDENK